MDNNTRRLIENAVFDITIGCGDDTPMNRSGWAYIEMCLDRGINGLTEEERGFAHRCHARNVQEMRQP